MIKMINFLFCIHKYKYKFRYKFIFCDHKLMFENINTNTNSDTNVYLWLQNTDTNSDTNLYFVITKFIFCYYKFVLNRIFWYVLLFFTTYFIFVQQIMLKLEKKIDYMLFCNDVLIELLQYFIFFALLNKKIVVIKIKK